MILTPLTAQELILSKVYMKDGNVFIGEITRYESGIITVKTEYGTFNLDESKVKYITVSESELKESYKEPCIVLKDGKVIPGKISSYISVLKRVKVSSNYGDIIIDRFKDIALIVLGSTIEIVTFADPNLEQAVRNTLGIPAGQPITRADMTRLTSLDASGMNIQNLSGLEYAINLQTLWLFDNQISNISPLANLTNLQELWLGENQISNISPLANLTNLQELGLEHNLISDISLLANLTYLQELYLYNNQISNISPIVSNTGLGQGDEVYLQNNLLDLSPGSDDMQNIQILQNRGVAVAY
jgi:Leucine-rich repeat (LRR) protein